MNKFKMPVEVRGYRNMRLPTFDPSQNCVVDKWWSVCWNDNHSDDDIQQWDVDEGSQIPPF